MFLLIAIVILFSLLIDTINYYGIKLMMYRLKSSGIYNIILKSYVYISVLLLGYFIIHFIYIGYPGNDYVKFRSFFFLFGLYLLLYMPRIVFIISAIIQWFYYAVKNVFGNSNNYKVSRIPKRSFIIQKIGLGLSVISFFLVLYGMIWGKSDFIARQTTIYFKDLPKGFEGFKIAHISDVHLGSFKNRSDVLKGLKLLDTQNPDIVLFTGDMVNNIADEMDDYISDFAAIKPAYGKYAILGNHDMGDYLKWKNADLKFKELKRMIDYEQQMGFQMLLNQNDIIYRNGDSIALVGVENWGKPPFKQYGNLENALKGVETVAFKILLSHDPSHFQQRVKGKEKIQLTLSGHTHGMQVGIRCCAWKWSPVSFVYELWNGLYQFGDNYLYVNPGFGFIGMPARIGIRPEISILTLRSISNKPQGNE
ncbi:MAG: metallophosphoesterase [Bacteroidetes bacterium]|nr:MAG: metallophosphoesterase [Bacteroidota bacterium]